MPATNPSYGPVERTIDLLEREHEVIRRRMPLALDIRDQLVARRTDLRPAHIAEALQRIVCSKAYLEACTLPLI